MSLRILKVKNDPQNSSAYEKYEYRHLGNSLQEVLKLKLNFQKNESLLAKLHSL